VAVHASEKPPSVQPPVPTHVKVGPPPPPPWAQHTGVAPLHVRFCPQGTPASLGPPPLLEPLLPPLLPPLLLPLLLPPLLPPLLLPELDDAPLLLPAWPPPSSPLLPTFDVDPPQDAASAVAVNPLTRRNWM